MKKTAKKLVLSKETVRNLEESVFGKVAAATGRTYGAQCVTWFCPSTDGPFECAAACD